MPRDLDQEEEKTQISTYNCPATFCKDLTGRIPVTFPDFPRFATDGRQAQAMEVAIDCLGSAVAMAGKDREKVVRHFGKKYAKTAGFQLVACSGFEGGTGCSGRDHRASRSYLLGRMVGNPLRTGRKPCQWT
jgi:hypothetical protein